MKSEKKLPGKNIERSNKIVAWLKDHDLISRNALCTRAGYDVANLFKVINGTHSYIAIPPKHLDEFERILKDYGFDAVVQEQKSSPMQIEGGNVNGYNTGWNELFPS